MGLWKLSFAITSFKLSCPLKLLITFKDFPPSKRNSVHVKSYLKCYDRTSQPWQLYFYYSIMFLFFCFFKWTIPDIKIPCARVLARLSLTFGTRSERRNNKLGKNSLQNCSPVSTLSSSRFWHSCAYLQENIEFFKLFEAKLAIQHRIKSYRLMASSEQISITAVNYSKSITINCPYRLLYVLENNK